MGLSRVEREGLADLLVRIVGEEVPDPVAAGVERSGRARSTVRRHLERLVEEGRLTRTGARGRRRYHLPPYLLDRCEVDARRAAPAATWRGWLGPRVEDLPEGARDVLWHGLETVLELARGLSRSGGPRRLELTLVRTAPYDRLVARLNGPGVLASLARGSAACPAQVALRLAGGEVGGGRLDELARTFDQVRLEADGIALERAGERAAWRLSPALDGSSGTRLALRLDADREHGLAGLGRPDPRRAWLPAPWLGRGTAELVPDAEWTPLLLEAARSLRELTLDFEGVERLAAELAELLLAPRPDGPAVRRSGAGPEVEQTLRAALAGRLSAR